MLAVHLERCGVDFTWHDTLSPINAWSASTGAIYPGGSMKFGPDRQCWEVWQRWSQDGYFGDMLEAANYWFGQKHPPHGGKYGVVAEHAGMRRAAVPSYHLNAQRFVPWVRERFRAWERKPNEQGYLDLGAASIYLVSHGFGERFNRAYWGWTRLIELATEAELQQPWPRSAFYFRPNKFVMAYAYPVAGTNRWYAGSSLIMQRPGKLRDLDPYPKYEKWKAKFLQFTNGAATIVDEGIFLTGWRPAAAPADEVWLAEEHAGIYSLRPLWNSGIRHFPKQWAAVAKFLGLPEREWSGLA
jgi:hypothetical protein